MPKDQTQQQELESWMDSLGFWGVDHVAGTTWYRGPLAEPDLTVSNENALFFYQALERAKVQVRIEESELAIESWLHEEPYFLERIDELNTELAALEKNNA